MPPPRTQRPPGPVRCRVRPPDRRRRPAPPPTRAAPPHAASRSAAAPPRRTRGYGRDTVARRRASRGRSRGRRTRRRAPRDARPRPLAGSGSRPAPGSSAAGALQLAPASRERATRRSRSPVVPSAAALQDVRVAPDRLVERVGRHPDGDPRPAAVGRELRAGVVAGVVRGVAVERGGRREDRTGAPARPGRRRRLAPVRAQRWRGGTSAPIR